MQELTLHSPSPFELRVFKDETDSIVRNEFVGFASVFGMDF